MSIVYDTGMLIAADRDQRNAWALHRELLDRGLTPLTTAPVVAQASRSGQQVRLRRFLSGCETVAFEPRQAHPVGQLLGTSHTSDVVDAHIVIVASEHRAAVLTSDEDDIERLSQCLDDPILVEPL